MESVVVCLWGIGSQGTCHWKPLSQRSSRNVASCIKGSPPPRSSGAAMGVEAAAVLEAEVVPLLGSVRVPKLNASRDGTRVPTVSAATKGRARAAGGWDRAAADEIGKPRPAPVGIIIGISDATCLARSDWSAAILI